MSHVDKQDSDSAAPELKEPVHGLSLHYDGSERRTGRRIEDEIEKRTARPAGKLSAVLYRLRLLWVSQAHPARMSRLDGARFITDAEWAALGDSALFAKLRAQGGGGENGGNASADPGAPSTDDRNAPHGQETVAVVCPLCEEDHAASSGIERGSGPRTRP